MSIRKRKAISDHSSAFHEEQLPLFDAYVTDELAENEKAQIERNLQHCEECQQLFAKVTHLRHALATLSEAEKPAISERTFLHSSTIVNTILAQIEQREKERNTPSTDLARQAQISFRLPNAYSPALVARRRVRSIYLSIGAAVCCVLLLVGLIVVLRNASSSGNRQTSVPAPMPWATQQHSMLVQNSAGIFALKSIEITTAKEFRFYYAFKLSSQGKGTIHATAVSSLNVGQNQQPMTLSTTVLPLGTIDNIDVGLIRVQYLNLIGQTITLNITSPDEEGVSWQLTPLKQVEAEPHPEGGGFYGFSIDQHLFPEIIWSRRSRPSSQSMVSIFKNASGTHYAFLEVDYAGKAVVINKEQCIQLVGEQECQ